MSDEVVQGTGAYLTLAVESLESQLTAAETIMREVAEELRRRDAWAHVGAPGAPTATRLNDLADRLDPPLVDTEEHDG